MLKQDNWVQVETFDRSIIISKILREGEVYNVPELQNIYMDTGNAGGLEVIINGTNIGVIGDAGQVKRRLPLNENGLRNVVKNYKLYGVIE